MRIAIALLLAASFAQADDEVASRIPPELQNCVAIQRNSERLACFDRGIAALTAAPGKTVAAPSAESTFGLLSSEHSPETARAVKREDLESLTATVRSLGRASDGSLLITLDNGQSWRQLSSGDVLLRVGDSVTINRAVLGTFQMVVPSGRSAKVKRTR